MADKKEKNDNTEKYELYEEILALVRENDGIRENDLLRVMTKKKFNIESAIPSEKVPEVEAYGRKIKSRLADLVIQYQKLSMTDDKIFLRKREEISPELFGEIKDLYRNNIEFVEPEAYDFFPCWIIGTYIFEVFESYPYVYLHSPKRSGKTKTLTLTSKLAHNSEFAVNMNQAVSYRIIEDKKPTLLIDEADYLSKEERAELYKILNAGYKKGSYVYRCEVNGKKIDYRKWNVYCPKILASVDELKDQFIDRCITFHLVRSRDKKIANAIIRENVDNRGTEWEHYTSQLEEYALKMKTRILEEFDEIDKDKRMEEIIGRDRELWLPVLAVGKAIGNEVYANLINLALDKVQRSKEQEKESLENAVISELLVMVNENAWVYSKNIHERMKLKPEWDWLNPRTTGKVMKRLNFRLKHDSKGSMYLVNVDELKELARRYSVEVNDNNEVSDNSDKNDRND